MTDTWEDNVRSLFAQLKGNREVTECTVNGLNIKVFPDVFSPAVFFESGWYAEKLASIVGNKSLLEIGTGTGIIALVSAIHGARVTATDINDKAVENAKLNFEAHAVDVKVLLGDIYESLAKSDRFDFIFWNHPFNKSLAEESDVFLRSVFDHGYEDLERYVSNASRHLNPGGKLLLGTSNIAKIGDLEEVAGRYSYNLVLLEKIDRKTEVNGRDIDFRIYEFAKKTA